MQAHPCGTAEAVANDVLHGHVGTELRAVVDVARFAEGRVGAAHVVVVASQHYRAADVAPAYGIVEGQGNLSAAFGIGIEYARLGAYHEFVLTCAAYPVKVVGQLPLDVLGSIGQHLLEHVGCQLVAVRKVVGIAGGAYPAEGAEAIVEEHRAHDVLNVRRITEAAVGLEHIGSGSARLEEEGVAVVEEVHSFLGQSVDGSHLAAQ